MRHVMVVVAVGLICAGAVPLAQETGASQDPLIGSWSGTFEGDSSGTFTMSIGRDESKNLGGTLEVLPEVGEGYSAKFRTVDVDGNAVTLTYDTPGEGAKVQLDGTLDGKTLKGAWKVTDTATNSVASSGSFTSSRQ
jgi:hypothetical protein